MDDSRRTQRRTIRSSLPSQALVSSDLVKVPVTGDTAGTRNTYRQYQEEKQKVRSVTPTQFTRVKPTIVEEEYEPDFEEEYEPEYYAHAPRQVSGFMLVLKGLAETFGAIIVFVCQNYHTILGKIALASVVVWLITEFLVLTHFRFF